MRKGTFVSIWDGGIEISTPAELDEKTGEVTTGVSDVQGLEVLEEEKFVDDDGDEHEICGCCHTYIRKTIMMPGVGKTLQEVKVCSDYYCENGEGNFFI